MSDCLTLEGEVVRGKRITSGQRVDPETGLTDTIRKQKPYFAERGVKGIEDMYNGTVNMDISPREFRITEPDYELLDIPWSDKLPEPESFWLVHASTEYQDRDYEGYIYYPLPSEVKSHSNNIVEMLFPFIEGLEYGDELRVEVDSDKVELV